MPRPSRYPHQLNVHVDDDAYEAVKRISADREATTGVRPQNADVWREAISRGLQSLELGETSGGLTAVPPTHHDDAHALESLIKVMQILCAALEKTKSARLRDVLKPVPDLAMAAWKAATDFDLRKDLSLAIGRLQILLEPSPMEVVDDTLKQARRDARVKGG